MFNLVQNLFFGMEVLDSHVPFRLSFCSNLLAINRDINGGTVNNTLKTNGWYIKKKLLRLLRTIIFFDNFTND